jgi:hypothetical protein
LKLWKYWQLAKGKLAKESLSDPNIR